jgi:hypothetical protein
MTWNIQHAGLMLKKLGGPGLNQGAWALAHPVEPPPDRGTFFFYRGTFFLGPRTFFPGTFLSAPVGYLKLAASCLGCL